MRFSYYVCVVMLASNLMLQCVGELGHTPANAAPTRQHSQRPVPVTRPCCAAYLWQTLQQTKIPCAPHGKPWVLLQPQKPPFASRQQHRHSYTGQDPPPMPSTCHSASGQNCVMCFSTSRSADRMQQLDSSCEKISIPLAVAAGVHKGTHQQAHLTPALTASD